MFLKNRSQPSPYVVVPAKNHLNLLQVHWFVLLFFTFIGFSQLSAQTAPELLYYRFDEGDSVTYNRASQPDGHLVFAKLTGLETTPGGLGGSNALKGLGTGGTSTIVNTNWETNFFGDWTLSFGLQLAGPVSKRHYLFGDSLAFELQCYIDHPSSPTDLVIHAVGVPDWLDVRIPGGAKTFYQTIHLVYDLDAEQIRAYIDGVLVSSTPEPFLVFNNFGGQASEFTIGGYENHPGLPLNALMDEFRLYNRNLDAAEIGSTWGVELTAPWPFADIRAEVLTAPVDLASGVYGTGENIRLQVRNTGISTIDLSVNPLSAFCDVQGPNPQYFSQTISGLVLAPSESTVVSFSSAYDMSDSGSYVFSAGADLPAGLDEMTSNDSLAPAQFNQICVDLFPWHSGFETSLAGGNGILGPPEEGVLYGGWTRNPSTGMTWWVERSAGLYLNTTKTGPVIDAEHGQRPGGNYLYLESSFLPTAATATVVSPCIDLSETLNPQLFYESHMYGSGMGKLLAEIDDGSGWVVLDSTLGEVQTSRFDSWTEHFIDLNPWAGNQVHIRFRGISMGDPLGDMAIDNITIDDLITEDAGILTEETPPARCGQTSEYPLFVRIFNNGTKPVSNFDVHALLDGPLPLSVTENVGALTVMPSDTVTYLFSQSFDLSEDGFWDFTVWIDIPGDTLASNDTAHTPLIENYNDPISTFPFSLDFSLFDNLVPGPGIDTLEGWVFQSGSASMGTALRWLNDVRTPTFVSGPALDHSPGDSVFLYLSSDGLAPDDAVVYSPCIDLGTMTHPSLSFWYHMFGPDMGELEMRIFTSEDGFQTVYTISGQQQDSPFSEWKQAFADLSPWAGQQIQLQIIGHQLTAGPGGHMAIDDLLIYDRADHDLSVRSIIDPQPSCGYSSLQHVSVELFNEGLLPASGFNLELEVTGPLPQSYVENAGALIIPPQSSAVFTFSGTVDLSGHGIHKLTVTGGLASDTVANNDTARLQLPNITYAFSLPYEQDFESFTDFGTAVNYAGLTADGWTRSATYDWPQCTWRVAPNSTIAPGCGALKDHTEDPGVNFLYFGSEFDLPFTPLWQASLHSPCFTADTLDRVNLSFWYHRNGVQPPLYLDVTSGGVTTSGVFTLNAAEPASDTSAWIQAIVDLTPYIGNEFQFSFRSTDTLDCGPSSVDDIRLFAPPPIDAALLKASLDVGFCDYSAVPVNLQLINLGYDTITSFSAGISITNSSGLTIGSATESSGSVVLVNPDTLFFSFSSVFDLSTEDDYTISIWISTASDAESGNDSLAFVFTSGPVVTDWILNEDFESGQAGSPGVLPAGWSEYPRTAPAWFMEESGVENSIASGPENDHTTSSGLYVYLENTGVTHSDTSRLLSRCIDLSGMILPRLEFWYHMYGADMGSLSVDMISADTVIYNIFSISGQQQLSPSADWIKATVDLGTFPENIYSFRFNGLSGGNLSDMALDDVRISDVGRPNAAIAGAWAELFCTTDEVEVSVDVLNLSEAPLTGFDLKAQFTGPQTVILSESAISASISPGDTLHYVFSDPALLPRAGLYDFTMHLTLADDIDTSDNTTSESLLRIPETTIPFQDGFTSSVSGLPGMTSNYWARPYTNAENGWFVETTGEEYTPLTGPLADVSGVGNYLFLEFGPGPDTLWDALLYSPCLDLTDAVLPYLNFWYYRLGSDLDTTSVDIWADGVWHNDAIALNRQDDEWISRQKMLNDYTGQKIVLRFDGRAFGPLSEFAIDDIVISDQILGIDQFTLNEAFVSVRPNPASDLITIHSSALGQNASLTLRNMHGLALINMEWPASSSTTEINVGSFASGIYLLELRSQKGVIAKRFVIQR